jgi:hypothetical protein
MSDAVKLLLFLGGYIVLMRWVFPRLGIRTCLSGNCGVRPYRDRSSQSVENNKEAGQSQPEQPESRSRS